MNETFSVKRLPGSRSIRDLMVTSGRGHFKDSIGLFDICVRKGPLRMNKNLSQIEEELVESDVTDAEGSLHQEPRDVLGH